MEFIKQYFIISPRLGKKVKDCYCKAKKKRIDELCSKREYIFEIIHPVVVSYIQSVKKIMNDNSKLYDRDRPHMNELLAIDFISCNCKKC